MEDEELVDAMCLFAFYAADKFNEDFAHALELGVFVKIVAPVRFAGEEVGTKDN